MPKLQGRRTNQGPTFGQLLNKYTKAVQQDRPLKKRPHSPPRRGNASPPKREFIRRRSNYPQFPPQKVYASMPWSPPASNAVNLVWEHEGIWLQCFSNAISTTISEGGKIKDASTRPIGSTPIWSSSAGATGQTGPL